MTEPSGSDGSEGVDEAGGHEDDLSPYVPAGAPAAPVPKRSAKVAVAAGLAVALVAGVLAVASLTSTGGSGTPEDAARKLIEAVAAEDVLGALEALVPGERAVLRDRLVDISGELGRLGILDEGLDLGHVPGADIAIDGLELRSEALSTDVASVLVAGGRATFSVAVDDLPLGPVITELNDDQAAESPPPATTELGNDDDLRLVTVREDGDWFVSLGYTFAEAVRRDSDAAVPDFDEPLEPRGEATPEAVIREMARAGAAFDARRVVELVSPGDAGALHAYAPVFLEGIESMARDLRGSGVGAAVSELEVSSKESGDEARVTIDRLTVDITTQDGPRTFAYDGRCASFEQSGNEDESFEFCAGDPALGPVAGMALTGTTYTVVRREGSWFLSPVATFLDGTLESLRSVNAEDVRKAVDEQGPLAVGSLVSPILGLFLFGAVGRGYDSSVEYGAPPSAACFAPDGAAPAAEPAQRLAGGFCPAPEPPTAVASTQPAPVTSAP